MSDTITIKVPKDLLELASVYPEKGMTEEEAWIYMVRRGKKDYLYRRNRNKENAEAIKAYRKAKRS